MDVSQKDIGQCPRSPASAISSATRLSSLLIKGWDPWLCVTGLLQFCLYRSRSCEMLSLVPNPLSRSTTGPKRLRTRKNPPFNVPETGVITVRTTRPGSSHSLRRPGRPSHGGGPVTLRDRVAPALLLSESHETVGKMNERRLDHRDPKVHVGG